MINLTPINKKIQKRLFEKMDVFGRKTAHTVNEFGYFDDPLTYKDIATRSTFLRMTSGQLNPVILMGGKLKDDGSMYGGYDDIYGTRTYKEGGKRGIFEGGVELVDEETLDFASVAGETKTLENKLKRPIPGVKGVDVSFKGGVRALREATISWTCWSFEELDLLMPHFLAHGKTVMIEWGWVYDKYTLLDLPDFLSTDTAGNKFLSADIYSNYRKQIFDKKGNFDMMVGIIKNFEFTTREDGGFDCQTILTSVGASILENPQANDVVLDPNIVYNLSINENDRETAEKLTKAVGEVGKDEDKPIIDGDTTSLVTLNTSVSLKLFIKEIDTYLLTDMAQSETSIQEIFSGGEKFVPDKVYNQGTIIVEPNKYLMGFNAQPYDIKSGIKSIIEKGQKISPGRYSHRVKAAQPNFWVRWGWFEDNILSKFLSVTSNAAGKEGEPYNPVVTEFRSIERKLDINSDDSNKYESVRIKNHSELQTTNINHYILPGQFYTKDPDTLDIDGKPRQLDGDSKFLRKLVDITKNKKNFSPFTTSTSKIERVQNVYETVEELNMIGKVKGYKQVATGKTEKVEVEVPGKHGYLRNMLINTKLIKQAFGVSDTDTFTVESINVVESMESLFSLLNQELNFWNYKIVTDEVETHRAKIIDDQVTNFDFDKTTTDQKSFIEGGEVKSINSGEEGVFFFPVWRSDSIVKRQNITAKIPDAMQLAIMYGSNMDQLKDFANPGGQFAEKEGVLAGGLFNKNLDDRLGGLDIAIRNPITKNLGIFHGIKEDGEPYDDASQSLNLDLNAGDKVLQFLKNNSTLLEKKFEERLKDINTELDISKQTQDAFKLEFDDSIPPPIASQLDDVQLKKLLEFEENRRILGFNLGALTNFFGSVFNYFGEMKTQFKRSVSYLTTQHGINKQANTPLLIPLELELEIDGIGGIYPGNSFHSSYVPSRYQKNTVFQIFDVNHRLDSSGWTVTLAGKMRATMNNIFDGYRKLEELKKEQIDNYVNKAKIAHKKKLDDVRENVNKLIDRGYNSDEIYNTYPSFFESYKEAEEYRKKRRANSGG